MSKQAQSVLIDLFLEGKSEAGYVQSNSPSPISKEVRNMQDRLGANEVA